MALLKCVDWFEHVFQISVHKKGRDSPPTLQLNLQKYMSSSSQRILFSWNYLNIDLNTYMYFYDNYHVSFF